MSLQQPRTVLGGETKDNDDQVLVEPVEEDVSAKSPKFSGMCQLGINIDCRDEVFCCQMSPSGKMVAVGTNKGITRIFNVEMGKKLTHQY